MADEATNGESRIRRNDALAAAPMQNGTTMVPYRERSPRASPNTPTWANGTGPLTDSEKTSMIDAYLQEPRGRFDPLSLKGLGEYIRNQGVLFEGCPCKFLKGTPYDVFLGGMVKPA